jgi:hypothetical protein
MDDRARDLLAEARVAKTNVSNAMEQFEARVWAIAWDRGYAQGWREGYQYALWQIEQARNQVVQATPDALAAKRPAPEAALPLDEDEDGSGPTAQETVLRIVKTMPGLRGVDIVQKAAENGRPVKERTVRTALHRLKNADEIVNVNERWYTPDAAPYHGGAP